MIILESWEKLCAECGDVKLEPDIYANPDINPRIEGNPWHCPKCKTQYREKDLRTYREHIEIIQKYYAEGFLRE